MLQEIVWLDFDKLAILFWHLFLCFFAKICNLLDASRMHKKLKNNILIVAQSRIIYDLCWELESMRRIRIDDQL